MAQLYIISGMSGAGKSQALKIFEDFGFFCVDNMPVQMFAGFADICLENPNKYKNIAVSVDSRAGESLAYFENALTALKKKKIVCKIVFLSASDSILARRYSETRHRHPLGESVPEGIKLERKALEGIFKAADEVIDTSSITVPELKRVISAFIGVFPLGRQCLNISVLSFGYKYGIPDSADIIYDMRFLANPYYVRGLKFKTGIDETVKRYIEKQREFRVFFDAFSKLVEKTLPSYVKEGRSYLTIALGCTGGRHRSVCVAEKLAEFLKNKKCKVNLNHRDILC